MIETDALYEIKEKISESIKLVELAESRLDTRGFDKARDELKNSKYRLQESKMWLDKFLKSIGQ